MTWRWYDTLAVWGFIIGGMIGVVIVLTLTFPFWLPRWIKTGKVGS